MMTSATTELTILPNAAPITTPTARSMTLPFMANSLNSEAKLMDGSPYARGNSYFTLPAGYEKETGVANKRPPEGGLYELERLSRCYAAAAFFFRARCGAASPSVAAASAFFVRRGGALLARGVSAAAAAAGPSTNCISAMGAESPARG